ncbi:cupin domain-containing protein [Acinetobacter gerneri]|uniref:cupin domain-containing protein n=1 Tax=Acinetobacter gerneri TaxID=202952 RepID=UPI0028ADD41B|nr:cupin domain-containing protein [Acinetobacter gerneri]
MKINADFNQSYLLDSGQYQWIASPQTGIERVMLDRIGHEKARATSIVRYAPQSFFPEHSHPNGEEIFVLEGVFTEDKIDYPAGYYLRNPHGSSHSPSSQDGALIFVKLRQMDQKDQAFVRINTDLQDCWHTMNIAGQSNPVKVCPLFKNDHENVALYLFENNHFIETESDCYTEILIIEGALCCDQVIYPEKSWMRLAKGSNKSLFCVNDRVKIYMKTLKYQINL